MFAAGSVNLFVLSLFHQPSVHSYSSFVQIRASIGSVPGKVGGKGIPLEDYVLSILGKYAIEDPARPTDTRDAQFIRIALLVRSCIHSYYPVLY